MGKEEVREGRVRSEVGTNRCLQFTHIQTKMSRITKKKRVVVEEEENEDEEEKEKGLTLPLTHTQAKELVSFLTRGDLSTEEIRTIQAQVSQIDDGLSEMLHSTHRKPDTLQLWRGYWTDYLEKTVEKDKDGLLDWVCSHIVSGPKITTYQVPAKHGSVINYRLLSFETLEEDGTKQKILVEHYEFSMGYDETGVRLFSAEIEKCDGTYADHRTHLCDYEIPAKVPKCKDIDSFFGCDQPGEAFTSGKDPKTYRVWQVILSMIDFYEREGWEEIW